MKEIIGRIAAINKPLNEENEIYDRNTTFDFLKKQNKKCDKCNKVFKIKELNHVVYDMHQIGLDIDKYICYECLKIYPTFDEALKIYREWRKL
jgi:DNA-binding transcriptional regulator YhcF (GntR family)